MMIRIPKWVTDEANRLAVETNLRLYVVGPYADWVVRARNDRPNEIDVIVVGPKDEYDDQEKETVAGEKDSHGDEVRHGRTRFGGLRSHYSDVCPADGIARKDEWWHPTLADYLNKQDKGAGNVVDPVTCKAWCARVGLSETAGVYQDGKLIGSVSVGHRETLHDAEAAVRKIAKKAGQVELRDGGIVVHLFDAEGEPEKAAPDAPAPARFTYGARYDSGFSPAFGDDRNYKHSVQAVFTSEKPAWDAGPEAFAALKAAGAVEPYPIPHSVRMYVGPLDGTGKKMLNPSDFVVAPRPPAVKFKTAHSYDYWAGHGLITFDVPAGDADVQSRVVDAARVALEKAGRRCAVGTVLGIGTARPEDKSRVTGLDGKNFTV